MRSILSMFPNPEEIRRKLEKLLGGGSGVNPHIVAAKLQVSEAVGGVIAQAMEEGGGVAVRLSPEGVDAWAKAKVEAAAQELGIPLAFFSADVHDGFTAQAVPLDPTVLVQKRDALMADPNVGSLIDSAGIGENGLVVTIHRGLATAAAQQAVTDAAEALGLKGPVTFFSAE